MLVLFCSKCGKKCDGWLKAVQNDGNEVEWLCGVCQKGFPSGSPDVISQEDVKKEREKVFSKMTRAEQIKNYSKIRKGG